MRRQDVRVTSGDGKGPLFSLSIAPSCVAAKNAPASGRSSGVAALGSGLLPTGRSRRHSLTREHMRWLYSIGIVCDDRVRVNEAAEAGAALDSAALAFRGLVMTDGISGGTSCDAGEGDGRRNGLMRRAATSWRSATISSSSRSCERKKAALAPSTPEHSNTCTVDGAGDPTGSTSQTRAPAQTSIRTSTGRANASWHVPVEVGSRADPAIRDPPNAARSGYRKHDRSALRIEGPASRVMWSEGAGT